MGRLAGFDYKSPYYYMVTLKRLKGLKAFSEIGPDGLIENEITRKELYERCHEMIDLAITGLS